VIKKRAFPGVLYGSELKKLLSMYFSTLAFYSQGAKVRFYLLKELSGFHPIMFLD